MTVGSPLRSFFEISASTHVAERDAELHDALLEGDLRGPLRQGGGRLWRVGGLSAKAARIWVVEASELTTQMGPGEVEAAHCRVPRRAGMSPKKFENASVAPPTLVSTRRPRLYVMSSGTRSKPS
jgi:hypothetical protein